ncbi:hypothetical protein [Mesorhizobium mediterraneum]|uniref:hypothetical protein n=1 Tax=Mesorhizobium mediterraneum TaxID=43617 RepID=UPI0017840A67|nr:hypothetical protein [Mesorhizobium mediterraneum]
MRKGGGSAAGHAGDGPAEIGLSEILSIALGDRPKPGVDFEQMTRLGADELEEVMIDECTKV